ncbi:DNA polymerase III subunit gamma/tau [Gammaproteobacteria bacterium]|nr:DNA polymerase III subunit gamma/tau [Gammaproteobacteria bacterium]
MSYQVLARKWRPRSFKEMAGQGHVLKTLINALDNDRLHHAYLFTGTRGVGKTTIARILARCLNCEEGVSSEPCGKCSACLEIEEGRFIDLIEVDAASRTKVEDTRELLDNVQYAPSRGRYKVYLIDEVHMLSGHSFNALLKTLEEPPPHVKFLLATTDPQKLPVTVLSRCLQFSLKNLSPEMIMNHLKFIMEQEKIEFEEEALWQIGRAAKGSVRDALTLLDQAISFCNGKLSDAEISSFLGTIDQNILYQLVDALIAEDALAILELINTVSDQAPDFASILEALLSYLHRVAVAQVVPEGLDNSQGDKKQILEHAAAMPAENVQLYYQMALKSREELPLAVDDRSGIEMALLRMLAFTPKGVPNKPEIALAKANTAEVVLNSKDDVISENISIDNGSDEEQLAEAEDEKKKSLESVEEKIQADINAKTNTETIITEAVSENSEPENEIQNESDSTAAQVPEFENSEEKLSLSALKPEQWISLFYKLNLSGITRSIAAHCLLLDVSENIITLGLDVNHSKILNEGHQEQIEKAMSDYFSSNISLKISQSELDSDLETPATYRLRKQQERQHIAEEVFKNDDYVKTIMERFEGSILPDSIEPLTPEDY